MWVRGAPLIGVTAAYGVAIQMLDDPSDAALDLVWHRLHETRPTAINLRWALDEMKRVLSPLFPSDRAAVAWRRAGEIADEDIELNRSIGRHGLEIIKQIAAQKKPGEPVNILTHCNAGWLATVDYGTKIGTYLRALPAHDHAVPFYAGLPSPTIDGTVHDGLKEIPIEERSGDEVSYVQGKTAAGDIAQVRISPENSPAANPAFDV